MGSFAEKQLKANINVVCGIFLAGFHTLSLYYFLQNGFWVREYPGVPLVEFCIRVSPLVGLISFTIATTLILALRLFSCNASWIFPIFGNYGASLIFLSLFPRLFQLVLNNKVISADGFNNPTIIVFELFKLNAFNSLLGWGVALIVIYAARTLVPVWVELKTQRLKIREPRRGDR